MRSRVSILNVRIDRRQLLGSSLALLGAPRLAADPHGFVNVRALVVGIASYQTTARSLDYAGSDARLVWSSLPGSRVGSRLLVAEGTQSVTRADFLGALEETAGKASPDDLFLLFFAGHAQAIDGEPRLWASDYDMARAGSTSIGVDELRRWLERSCRARCSLLVLDACDSGRARGGSQHQWKEVFGSAQGIITLAAAELGKNAWEFADLQGGVFTHFLLEGISGSASPGKAAVSLADLEAYVVRQVNAYCSDQGRPPQNPVFLIPPALRGTSLPRGAAVPLAKPPPQDGLRERTRPLPGVVLLLEGSEAARPALDLYLSQALLKHGFPVGNRELARRAAELLHGAEEPAARETERQNARFLVRVQAEVTVDSVIRGFQRATVSLIPTMLDAATEHPLPLQYTAAPVVLSKAGATAPIQEAVRKAVEPLQAACATALRRASRLDGPSL